jgi:hypothetical protein
MCVDFIIKQSGEADRLRRFNSIPRHPELSGVIRRHPASSLVLFHAIILRHDKKFLDILDILRQFVIELYGTRIVRVLCILQCVRTVEY